MAYRKQSDSLKIVQTQGPTIERDIRDVLAWEGGRVVYHTFDETTYDVQVDAAWPSLENPQTVISVTYCNPDRPGHSNENKLQLKLGELMLLKSRHPDIRVAIAIGGTREAWMPYVLEVFQYFFDEVLFLWDHGSAARLEEIRDSPTSILQKHPALWRGFAKEWAQIALWTGEPINSGLRQGLWELMSEVGIEDSDPAGISNSVLRECMTAAYNAHKRTRGRVGKEWTSYLRGDWDALWQSRTYFNPAEAAIALILRHHHWAHVGSLAVDAVVPSLLHQIGGANVDRTKVSEDFILFSRKLNLPIFVQSKSTGGGLAGHGKNIQNRTKEQIARGLIYRGYVDSSDQSGPVVKTHDKDFVWIGVLDGNWGITRRSPLKYLHMLQWAGYDHLLAADDLVTDALDVDHTGAFAMLLTELDCVSDQGEFDALWDQWNRRRNR